MGKGLIDFNDRVDSIVEFNSDRFIFLKKPINWKDKVVFKCKKCESEFTKSASTIFADFENKERNCVNCSIKKKCSKKFTIEEASSVFKDRGYALLESEYKKITTKMKYHCEYCDSYNHMSLDNMMRGRNCPNCSSMKKVDIKIKNKVDCFGLKLIEIVRKEGDNTATNVTIKLICNEGHEFSVNWACFKNKKEYICKVCRGLQPNKNGKPDAQIKSEVESYILKNSLTYKFIDCYRSEYISKKRMFIKLIIKCEKHGVYEVESSSFFNGTRCNECMNERITFTIEEVKSRISEATFNKYEFLSDSYTNSKNKYSFKHLDCGKTFTTTLDSFLHAGARCEYCSNKMSNGEKHFYDFLESNNIKFETQYRFKDCKHKYTLPFDFAIFDEFHTLSMIIEIDGCQHREFNKFIHKTEDNFLEQISRDKIKTNYCKENDICLHRIAYNNIKDIDNWIELNKDLFK